MWLFDLFRFDMITIPLKSTSIFRFYAMPKHLSLFVFLRTCLLRHWNETDHYWHITEHTYLNIMSMLLSERVSERTSASVYLAVWLKCRTVYDDQQHCNESKILLRYSGWLKVGQFYFLLCLCVYKYVRTRHFKLTAIIILDFTGSLLTSSRKIIKTIFWL